MPLLKSKSIWILGSQDFTLLISTRFLVTFATQIQAVAVGWLVYKLKHDPIYLGLIGLTEAFPALGLSLFSGLVVDRGRPLRIYRGAIFGSSISASMLVLSTLPLAAAWRLPLCFLAAFITGAARSFINPSEFSILPLTLPRVLFGQGTAWNTSLNQIAALSGPALGGFLFAFGGERRTFLALLVFLLFALFASTKVKHGNEIRAAVANKPRLRESLFSGVKFVFANQIIVAAMALDMFGVLFGGATALFPIFAGEIFSKGPMGLGILRAAMPIGSFVMGWFLIKVPISRFSGKVMVIAFFGFGICMTAFGLSRSFELSVALLLVTGMFDSVSMVTRQTILQLKTPPEMRGRVAAVSAIFIGSSNEIGSFESGVAAKLMGTRRSVVFGGLMTLVVAAITWIAAPQLRDTQLSKL